MEEQQHDSVNCNGNGNGNEEDAYDATLRRAKEDFTFRGYFITALTSGDEEYISRIFGGLPANDPRVSELIAKQVAKRDFFKAKYKDKRIGLKGTSYFVPGQEDLIAQVRIDDRRNYADRFRRQYYFGRGIDQKTFVWPGGTHPWTDMSSGVAWLGVHGADSICVVTKARDLDMTRVHSTLKYITVEDVLFHLRKTVISEIEDIASSSSKLGEIFGQSIPKPFGVVSMVLGTGTDEVHEECDMESSDEEGKQARKKRMEYMPKFPGYDEKKTVIYLREQLRKDTTHANHETAKASEAIVFLQEKMKTMNIEAFTVDETIQVK